MNSAIAHPEQATQPYPQTGEMLLGQIDESAPPAMPVDYVRPSQVDFYTWKNIERAVRSQGLRVQTNSTSAIDCQIAFQQAKYRTVLMASPNRW